MKTNFKISQFSRILLKSGYPIYIKIWKWLKLLNSLPFIKKTRGNHVKFEFDHFDWLSQSYSEWRQTSKLVNLNISAKVGYVLLSKIWKWLKLLNSVPFIQKTLVNHVYIRIWSFWLTFTVFSEKDKLQN